MPLILKEPAPGSRGIIVFTHKEFWILKSRNAYVTSILSAAKERFVFGMHWGHFYEGLSAAPFVDFHLAGPGTLSFAPGYSAPRIPLCSRDFTPAVFRPRPDCEKFWDIIHVARPLALKNIDQFFLTMRVLFDGGFRGRALLVCSAPLEMSEKNGWYENVYADYLKTFSEQERSLFHFFMFRGDGYPFPQPPEVLAHLYASSRIFCLYSDQEGESRVIAEALLCGLPVVCKAHLRGGGRDLLHEKNSRLFTTPEEAAERFLEILAEPERFAFSTTELRDAIGEDASRHRFEAEIRSVFAHLGENFEGKTHFENLARTLPGHVLTLNPELRVEVTNDLRSEWAFCVYMTEYLHRRKSRWAYVRAHGQAWIMRAAASFRYRIGRAVRRSDALIFSKREKQAEP